MTEEEDKLNEELGALVRQAKKESRVRYGGVPGEAPANEALARLLAILITKLEKSSKSQDRLAKAEVIFAAVAAFFTFVQIFTLIFR